MFEQFGRLVDAVFEDAERALGSASRAAELRQAATGTLEVYFLWGTGWVPAPGAPPSLVDQWWGTARRSLHELVESAWTQGRDRKHILSAGLVRQRFLVVPPEPGPMSDRTMGLGAMLGIWRHWPELVPPSRTIAPLMVPAASRVPTGRSTAERVFEVNQRAYDERNEFMARWITATAEADRQRFERQQAWIQEQWIQSHW